MNICFLTENYSYNGGGERMLCNLVNNLCKEHKISVLSLNKTNDEPLYKLDKSISLVKCNVAKTKINFFMKFKYLNYIRKNKDVFNSFDVVIGLGFILSLALAACKKRFSCKLAAWEHTSFDQIRLYQKILFKLLFNRLDKVIILTNRDLPKYKKTNPRTQVIYNFTQMEFRKKPNFQNRQFIFIGRLTKLKGLDCLIKSIQKFSTQNNEWKFKIIGKGEYKGALEKFIKKEHLEDRVFLQDVSNDVQTELENSSCMLMLSRTEGLPMVLIEAQVCGLPAISFDTITGPAEIIADKKSGFIVPVGNVNAFVGAMREFAGNAELQESMHKASLVQGTLFQEDRIVAQWNDMLKTLEHSPSSN